MYFLLAYFPEAISGTINLSSKSSHTRNDGFGATVTVEDGGESVKSFSSFAHGLA